MKLKILQFLLSDQLCSVCHSKYNVIQQTNSDTIKKQNSVYKGPDPLKAFRLLTCSEISQGWLLKVTLMEQPFKCKSLSPLLFLFIFPPRTCSP